MCLFYFFCKIKRCQKEMVYSEKWAHRAPNDQFITNNSPIDSRANAKSLHALGPIRARTFRLRQSGCHIPAAPTRTRKLSSSLSDQRQILALFGESRLRTSHIITLKAVSFQYKFSSPLFVFWHRAILFLGSMASYFICIHHLPTNSTVLSAPYCVWRTHR